MIAGDSAGAGLALALMAKLRDMDREPPRCAFLASPWLDLSCSDASYDDAQIDDPMLTRAGLLADAQAYLNGVSPHLPLASPLNAELHDLPPLLIQCGDQEVLVGEIRRFAALANRAGVDCTLSQYRGMCHVWHAFAGLLPEADLAIEEACAFLKRHVVDLAHLVPPRSNPAHPDQTGLIPLPAFQNQA